jgi:hypothetical protein
MDPRPLRTNERLKAASGIATNLGSALLATAAARWFVSGFDPFVFLWLAVSATMIGLGIQVLGMLEVEYVG